MCFLMMLACIVGFMWTGDLQCLAVAGLFSIGYSLGRCALVLDKKFNSDDAI